MGLVGDRLMKKKIIVTKDDFKKYEDVRRSGMVNMYSIDVVQDLTLLEKEQILHIMKNYSQLAEDYL